MCLQVNAHHLAVLLPRVHLSGVRTHPLLSLLPSRSRQGSVGSYRRLYQAHRGKMPNMSDGRHMPTVSNNCDVCVWCVDGSCDFCDTAHALREPCALEQGLHSRERLSKRLSKRLRAGRCFLMVGAALHGRWCARCFAAHAMANASGLWAWRVLAPAWRVLALAWQVPAPSWQVLCIWQVRWQELVGRHRGHAMRELFEFK